MSIVRRPRHYIAPLTAAAALSAAPVFAQGLSTIRLETEKSLLRADGRTSTVITAQVFDNRGNAVADGTIVNFTATAGRLASNDVPTVGGIARVLFYAADQPGTAIITAALGGVTQSLPSRVTITFSRDADNAEFANPWIRISGPTYTGYIADNAIVQAIGKDGAAEFAFRNITLSADNIQYHARENWLIAVGNVTLKIGDETRSFRALRWNLEQGTGLAERIRDNRLSAYELSGPLLTETPFDKNRLLPATETWALADLSDAQMAVVARSIQIEPGKRLLFRRATFYASSVKMYSVPVHVMSLDQKFIYPKQLIGFSQQGLSVDVPVYYDVRPNTIGTLHVRHSARIGDSAYSIRPGWSFDTVQTYTGPQRMNGTVEINGLSRDDWGVNFSHAQQLGINTGASLYLNFPNHKNLLLNPQISHNFKDFYVSANGTGSLAPGYTDPTSGIKGPNSGALSGVLTAETHSRPVPNVKSLRYVLTAGLGKQHYFGGSQYLKGDALTNTLGTRLYTAPLPIARNTTLTQSAAYSHLWASHRGLAGNVLSGATFLATTTLNQTLGSLGSVGLSYDFTRTPANASQVTYGNGRHRLGLTGYMASGDAWDFNIFGSKALDVSQSSLYGSLGFKIKGPWRGRITHQLSEFGGYRIADTEFAITRHILDRDVTLYYSTTSRRLLIDFGTHL